MLQGSDREIGDAHSVVFCLILNQVGDGQIRVADGPDLVQGMTVFSPGNGLCAVQRMIGVQFRACLVCSAGKYAVREWVVFSVHSIARRHLEHAMLPSA